MGLWMWENEWWRSLCHVLPNVSCCCTFSKLHACTQALNLSAHMTSWRISSFSISPKTKTANFRPPTRHVYRPPRCQKCSPDVMQCNCRARTQEMREFIHAAGPSFTSFYDPDALMARERHSHQVGAALMRKRQTSCWGSVEIGAPVFITLVYRLNSRLPPLSSVLNVPLICSSCACTWNNSLKMNEKETQILSAVRWRSGKRKWEKNPKTVVLTQVTII